MQAIHPLLARLTRQNVLYMSPTFFLLLLTLTGCALPFSQNLTPEETGRGRHN